MSKKIASLVLGLLMVMGLAVPVMVSAIDAYDEPAVQGPDEPAVQGPDEDYQPPNQQTAQPINSQQPTSNAGQGSTATSVRTTIAIGSHSSYAISANGNLYAWGLNSMGQLGDGTTTDRRSPTRVPGLSNVVAVEAFGDIVYAILSDGSLWGWGNVINRGVSREVSIAAQQAGERFISSPAWIADNVASVAVGGGHVMMLRTDGSLYAVGSNFHGQLGDGTTAQALEFTRILDNVASIAAGGSSSFAIRSNGDLYAWGSNQQGQLGAGSTQAAHSPVRIMGDVSAVFADGDVSAAICTNGHLYTWGQNNVGQLGHAQGYRSFHSTPARVLSDVTSVSLGSRVMAIRSDGSLYVWGSNASSDHENALGLPGLRVPHTPTRAVNINGVAAVSSGMHALALRNNGSLYSWGFNNNGQVGDGMVQNRRVITRVMDNVMMPSVVVVGALPQAGGINLSTASGWAHDSITQAHSHGLIPANIQTNFTANATRAEFTAFAVALYETVTGREITERATFNDTTDINVQKMGGLGVVTGVGGGNFNPNGTITRQEAAVMLSRLIAQIDQPLPIVASTFADNALIASWAAQAVGQVQAAGIMGGVGNNQFNPTGNFTREQSIITMLRLFEELS